MLNLVIQLVSGAVGGNVAGGVLKKMDMGPFQNTVAGLVGGLIGGQAVSASGAMEGMIGQLAGGGISGAALMIIAGFVKNKVASS